MNSENPESLVHVSSCYIIKENYEIILYYWEN